MSLGKNILWNLGGFLWLTALLVFVTPFLVRRLGLDAYGVWSVLTASAGYLAAFDLGLGNALVRSLAADKETREGKGLEALLRSGVTLQILLGGLAGAVLYVLAPHLAGRWLRVPEDLVAEATASFRLGALAVFLGFPILAYASVPAALRRFDLLTARTIAVFTLHYVLFVVVLQLGGGLREVVLAHVAGTALALVFLIAVCKQLLPGCVLLPGWDRGAVKELFAFARYKFAAQISVTVLRELDRIAVAFLLPIGRVSFYAVPLRLSLRMTQVVEVVASPFYPAMTSQISGDRGEELRRQYRIGVRLVAAFSLGAAAILGGLAEPLLGVWLGPEFAQEGTWVLRIILLAYAASALFTLPSVAADGAGRPGIPAAFLAAAALVHVPLVFILTRQFGLPGTALSVLAGFLVAMAGVVEMHRRIPQLPPLSQCLSDLRGVVAASALTALVSVFVSRTSFPASGALPFLLTLLGAGVFYAGLLALFGSLRREDVARFLVAFRR